MFRILCFFLCFTLTAGRECKGLETNQEAEVQKLIEFGSSSDSYSKKVCKETILDWQEADKQHMLVLLARIKEACPGLIENAAAPGKLLLIVTADPPKAEIRGLNLDTSAIAHPKVIQFSTSLIHATSQEYLIVLSIIHELVHEADPGNLVSYSQEWCQLALPRMQTVRVDFQNDSDNIQKKLQRESKKRLLPTFNSAINLPECLADCYSYYICQNFIIDKRAASVFNRLCNPSSNDRAYNKQYRAGAYFLTINDNHSAIFYFRQAAELVPSNPEPFLQLGYLYVLLGENSKAIECFRKAIILFKNLRIPEWEDRMQCAIKNLKLLTKVPLLYL